MISQNLVSTWSPTCTCIICLPVFTNNTFSDLLNYVCWNIPLLRSCSEIHNRQDIWSMTSAKMCSMFYVRNWITAHKFCTGFEGINVTRVLFAQQKSFFTFCDGWTSEALSHVLIKALYSSDGSFKVPCQQSEPALVCITLQKLRHVLELWGECNVVLLN